MAPFGPVPAIVGKETSFSAPVSRRNVSSASTVSISVSAPMGASRSIQARNRASATAARRTDQAVQRVSGGRIVQCDRGAGLRQRRQARRQRVRLPDIGGLFEMVARAVGEFAM